MKNLERLTYACVVASMLCGIVALEISHHRLLTPPAAINGGSVGQCIQYDSSGALATALECSNAGITSSDILKGINDAGTVVSFGAGTDSSLNLELHEYSNANRVYLDKLATLLELHEGSVNKPLPGAGLVFSGQPGAFKDGVYARWYSDEVAHLAVIRDLAAKFERGETLETIMGTPERPVWCHPGPCRYAAELLREMGR
jgi:hypothetical protein